ncbi:MAG: flagellar hook-associated protein FlgL [Bacillota bacterium]|nr:flagellar hook-associated protein FlgL [Bacillota bacterium]
MRVTQNMMTNNLLRNLNRNLRGMEKLYDQMATGKKMNRPADDPANLVNALRNRTQRTEVAKYKSNVDDAMTWLENTDAALGEAGNVLQRIRELVVYGSTGTHPQDAKNAIADEVAQLRDHLAQVANSKVGDRYIFSGTNTLKPAVELGTDEVTGELTAAWQGNSKEIRFEIGQNVTVAVNVNGDKLFGSGNTPEESMFYLLGKIVDDLQNGGDVGANLGELDKQIDNVLAIRADVGARVNRLEMSDSWLTDLNINLTALSAKMEDVDMAEAFTRFTNLENVYRASLSVGSRIIQPSLIDFIR